ncbi:DUF1622 domain-containing protein [Spongiactinospora sp. TRM90649]|uniref:DUF1622 domain-containing protein n=1 Tax=Spongiactinospora sp. TRM90649 TaxID=3031114 RepID=UPI0023F68587|nr:DUF1622 domain-containing protein [Spongiactinospora sp. TRM90649]MDF5752115.1 DUF1622 domain-containing protein [Spongiactinospora sp. TRM90649]
MNPYESGSRAGGEVDHKHVIEVVGGALDVAGVVVIAVGMLAATAAFAVRATGSRRLDGGLYRTYREGVGRSILLGLEILVGADIVRTVAVKPTFEGVGVLAALVAVRTFLSMSLQVELEGRWPWQRTDQPGPASRAG